MQVGDWVYPLVPGHSPTLHAAYGAYVFPHPTAVSPNQCVGLVLPADLDASLRTQFDAMLREYTMYLQQHTSVGLSGDEQQRLSARLAGYLIRTGELCAYGVSRGTEKAAAAMVRTASDYRLRQQQRQEITVDRRVQTSVHYLRRGTKVAVKVSGYLVNALGRAALAIGKRAAGAVERTLGGPDTAAGGVFASTIEVVGGGVAGKRRFAHK
jgi:spartin